MDSRKRKPKLPQYQFESWRTVDDARGSSPTVREGSLVRTGSSADGANPASHSFNRETKSQPDVRDQTNVLMLLGRINYKIIKGGQVYIQAGGIVYRTLYGGYWRSVFTGVEHYLFKCEQVSGSIWAEDDLANTELELPIVFSNDGWTANGHSLSFMLTSD
jgi:hypothetical protein